jgi:hypothetical protein
MFQEEIETICDTKGVWLKIEHDKKPDLKVIRIEITIKVENDPRS